MYRFFLFLRDSCRILCDGVSRQNRVRVPARGISRLRLKILPFSANEWLSPLGYGGFSCQLPLRILAALDYIVARVHFCFWVAGLDSEPDFGSICWISCWWMEMFTGCGGEGAIESVSVGEIKLSLRQSLVKLGVGFISRDPKLQVLICDLEVVMRPSNKSPGKKKTRKSRASGRGKWMIVGNIARYLSVCVTDLVLKTPKFTVEIKELNVDISKDGGSKSNLLVGLQILPIFVHIGEPRVSCDFLSNLSGGGCSSSGQASITALERSSAPFICEMFSVSCEFGHDREVGIVIKNMDISSGEMTVNLNEELLLKSKSPSKSSPGSDSKAGSHADSASTKMPSKKQQTLAAFSKFSSMFPEKVSFNLPKLDVSFVHREHGLSVENNIMGIQLKSTKSRSTEDLGESTRLDFQLEFSEIHLLREAGSSILEILKLDLISFVYIPIQMLPLHQPISPVRAETEVKLGGTQCNIIMSRLKPWLFLHSSKKKKMVLQEEASVVARPQSTDGKTVMWTCNVSAPEMTIVLFNMAGSPVYHVQGLKRELVIAQISRKAASASLRTALQKAAQLRLTEKEKNKSPSYAMRISLQINRVAWSMLVDGKSFAEAEINDMIYDFDRDYKDVGIARFTTKYFVVRNCLPNVKSDMLLSAWNPPSEWGKKVMLRVDARQGAPKDGNSPLELFEIEIYPLKIHLTETMYRMMWEYFFPEEEQDSQRRQEVWKVSTTAGARRVKKGSSVLEASASNSHTTKESEASSKSGISAMLFPTSSQPPAHVDSAQASKTQNVKANPGNGATPELRRTSSFDRTWEETVAESVANELVLQSFSSSKNGQFGSTEQQDEAAKNKSKDSKGVKGGRSSHEEKKVAKSHEEKRSRPRKMMEFHNIKISQVELLVTYEGQRFVVNDLKLLMDQFHRTEFTGTWRRLFSRVKKHIIWGVLKSVTGMQGRKFNRPTGAGVPEIDLILSDNEGQAGKSDQYPPSWPKRPSDGAGDGFVTSIRGLFSTQRRKAKAFVLRTMRGEAENDFQGDWSESDMDFSPFARQLTITRAKKLIRRHTKKFRSRGQKGSTSQQRESLPSSPRETTPFDSDSSSGSSPYEDFHE
ncbi:Protein SABRE [Glycine soja]